MNSPFASMHAQIKKRSACTPQNIKAMLKVHRQLKEEYIHAWRSLSETKQRIACMDFSHPALSRTLERKQHRAQVELAEWTVLDLPLLEHFPKQIKSIAPNSEKEYQSLCVSLGLAICSLEYAWDSINQIITNLDKHNL